MELAWVNNPLQAQAQPSLTSTPTTAQQKQIEIAQSSTEIAQPSMEATVGENGAKNANTAVEDYDLADDDEGRWLAE